MILVEEIALGLKGTQTLLVFPRQLVDLLQVIEDQTPLF